jgi:hypothetical protein
MDNDKWHEPPKWEDLPKTYECWGSGKADFDPAAPLMDFIVHDGQMVLNRIEQPVLGCTCCGIGLEGSWVFGRESKCSCSAQSDDFDNVLHTGECDIVPCPFCPLEAP